VTIFGERHDQMQRSGANDSRARAVRLYRLHQKKIAKSTRDAMIGIVVSTVVGILVIVLAGMSLAVWPGRSPAWSDFIWVGFGIMVLGWWIPVSIAAVAAGLAVHRWGWMAGSVFALGLPVLVFGKAITGEFFVTWIGVAATAASLTAYAVFAVVERSERRARRDVVWRAREERSARDGHPVRDADVLSGERNQNAKSWPRTTIRIRKITTITTRIDKTRPESRATP
jgi:hypothetical protein